MPNEFLSNEFFHLVGRDHETDDERNLRILKLILRDRCVKYPDCVPGESQTSLSVFRNRRLSSGEMFVSTCTCYCDIPLQSLGFHAKKYGRHGLSFHRDFLIRNGARPVVYVPKRADDRMAVRGTTLLDDMQVIYNAFWSRFCEPVRERGERRSRPLCKAPDTDDGIINSVHTVLALYFFAYVKPYDSELPPDHLHYYYSEREWRITNYVHFMPEDVERVVVSSARHGDEIALQFPEYANKLHVLT